MKSQSKHLKDFIEKNCKKTHSGYATWMFRTKIFDFCNFFVKITWKTLGTPKLGVSKQIAPRKPIPQLFLFRCQTYYGIMMSFVRLFSNFRGLISKPAITFFSVAIFRYELIQIIFKTRFSNEGSGKNDSWRFQHNDPASDDYPRDEPNWTIDDCVSHFANFEKRMPHREKSRLDRVRRNINNRFTTRHRPKYQYKSSNRTTYYAKSNRTISLRLGSSKLAFS